MFVLRASIGGVTGIARVAFVKEAAQKARAWLQGSDSESFDCPVFPGDGWGL
jgi:hypothetical protein